MVKVKGIFGVVYEVAEERFALSARAIVVECLAGFAGLGAGVQEARSVAVVGLHELGSGSGVDYCGVENYGAGFVGELGEEGELVVDEMSGCCGGR